MATAAASAIMMEEVAASAVAGTAASTRLHYYRRQAAALVSTDMVELPGERESGLQLFTRLKRPRALGTLGLPSPLFEDLQSGQIIELCGTSGSGKTELLLKALAHCLLPPLPPSARGDVNGGSHHNHFFSPSSAASSASSSAASSSASSMHSSASSYYKGGGGCGASALLITGGAPPPIARLARVMESIYTNWCSSSSNNIATAATAAAAAVADEGDDIGISPSHNYVSAVSDDDGGGLHSVSAVVRSALSRLQVVNCTESLEVLAALQHAWVLLDADPSIGIVALDAFDPALHWTERARHGSRTQQASRLPVAMLAALRRLQHHFSVPVVCTKPQIFSPKRDAVAAAVRQGIPVELVHREHMAHEWTLGVTHRYMLAQLAPGHHAICRWLPKPTMVSSFRIWAGGVSFDD